MFKRIKNLWNSCLSVILVGVVILLLVVGFFYLVITVIQSELALGVEIPAGPIWETSWESIVFSVGVVVAGIILAAIPSSLFFSLFLGTRRERIKGDLWADISRMRFEDYLARSAEFEILLDELDKKDEERVLIPHGVKQRVDRATKADEFRKRFDDFYGGLAYLIPVTLFTIVCFFGWMLVFFPTLFTAGEPVLIREMTFYGFAALIQDGAVSYLQAIAEAGSLFSFAFLGAYFWSLQNLLRRYLASDLKPGSFMVAAQRVVSGWVASLVFLVALPDNWVEPDATWWTPAFGFFLGIFTMPLVRALWKMTKKPPIPIGKRKEFGAENDLTELEGLNAFHADRLAEENVENIHALTTVNLLNLLTHTRYPSEMILDWVDQALLHRHARDASKTFIKHLRQLGILAASDLLDIWKNEDEGKGNLTRSELLDALSKLEDSKEDDLTKVKLKGIIDSLERAPNFWHVYNYWQQTREVSSRENS